MKANRNTVHLSDAPRPEAALPPELDPTPVLLTPPELVGREHEHVVICHDGDTDESFAGRCELVALIIEAAKKPCAFHHGR
jgi:hypothetical protein